MQKNEVRPLSLAIFKKKKLAQWIKDLNLRTETIRKQWGGGEKTVENRHDIRFGSYFLDMTLKAEATKEKNK